MGWRPRVRNRPANGILYSFIFAAFDRLRSTITSIGEPEAAHTTREITKVPVSRSLSLTQRFYELNVSSLNNITDFAEICTTIYHNIEYSGILNSLSLQNRLLSYLYHENSHTILVKKFDSDTRDMSLAGLRGNTYTRCHSESSITRHICLPHLREKPQYPVLLDNVIFECYALCV